MLRDAELFKSRLSKLDGAADVGDHVVNVVNSKVVSEKAAAPESKATSTETSSTDASSEKPTQDGEKT